MPLNGSDYEARRRRFQAAVRGGSCEPPVESPSRFHAALTLATSEAEVRCLFVNAPPPITLDLCSASEGASPSASADVDQVDEEEDQVEAPVEAKVEAHHSDTTAALQGASPSLLKTKHSSDDAPQQHARLDSVIVASPCRDMEVASRAPSRSRSSSRRARERQVTSAGAQRSTCTTCMTGASPSILQAKEDPVGDALLEHARGDDAVGGSPCRGKEQTSFKSPATSTLTTERAGALARSKPEQSAGVAPEARSGALPRLRRLGPLGSAWRSGAADHSLGASPW